MRLICRSFGVAKRLTSTRLQLCWKPEHFNHSSTHLLRQSSTMAQSSAFTRIVVASMRHLYPEPLADHTFDNTGLLLEAPSNPSRKPTALLTIDLTRAVADEAIQNNHSIIIAYHPIIFRGLKSLTLADPQQQSLLRLASEGISVYSPHTAVDCVPGGMADWLCDIVTGKIEPDPEPKAVTAQKSQEPQRSEPVSETDVTTSEDEDPFVNRRPHVHRTYSKPSYPSRGRGSEATMSPIQSTAETTFHPAVISHSRSVITSSLGASIAAANKAHGEEKYSAEDTGAGRLITFDEAQPLASLITRIAHATGTPKGFPVAIPQGASLERLDIRTVGICPGSGASVMRGCDVPPDLVFTGEMSHHEALAVIERGGCVVSLFHSNSERGYLDGVMREMLEEEVKKRWDGEGEVEVMVSRTDRDPFGIVVLQESSVKGEKVG